MSAAFLLSQPIAQAPNCPNRPLPVHLQHAQYRDHPPGRICSELGRRMMLPSPPFEDDGPLLSPVLGPSASLQPANTRRRLLARFRVSCIRCTHTHARLGGFGVSCISHPPIHQTKPLFEAVSGHAADCTVRALLCLSVSHPPPPRTLREPTITTLLPIQPSHLQRQGSACLLLASDKR